MQPSTKNEIRVDPYTPDQKAVWDAHVSNSRNGTFLLLRDYIDFASAGATDCSLIVRDGRDRVVALLPGNIDGSAYFSHGRLTYGGLVTDHTARLSSVLGAIDACMTWLSSQGVASMLYKAIPHIYHHSPAEEDRYAMFLLGARWVRSGMLAVVDQARPGEYQERRRRALKKAASRGLQVRVSADLPAYWEILADLLRQRHNAAPVHSLEQIEYLRSVFPDNIRLHACFDGERMVAGILAYVTDRVARAQYIASTPEARDMGAVDLIVDDLIRNAYASKMYIDLGTSEEEQGRAVNEGLIAQKEGFGARSVALDQYHVDVSTYEPGVLMRALR